MALGLNSCINWCWQMCGMAYELIWWMRKGTHYSLGPSLLFPGKAVSSCLNASLSQNAESAVLAITRHPLTSLSSLCTNLHVRTRLKIILYSYSYVVHLQLASILLAPTEWWRRVQTLIQLLFSLETRQTFRLILLCGLLGKYISANCYMAKRFRNM